MVSGLVMKVVNDDGSNYEMQMKSRKSSTVIFCKKNATWKSSQIALELKVASDRCGASVRRRFVVSQKCLWQLKTPPLTSRTKIDPIQDQ